MSWMKSKWLAVQTWASTLEISFLHFTVFLLHLLVLVILAVLWSPINLVGDREIFADETPGKCVATRRFSAFHVFPTSVPTPTPSQNDEPVPTPTMTADLLATPPQNVNYATKQAFTCNEWAGRVLLHPVGKGTEVSMEDVGPRIVQDGFEVITIRAVSPLTTVSAGDVVDLLIEPAEDATTPIPLAREATPDSAPSSSRRIVDATVLVVGEASDEDLLPVIVAVPLQPASNRTIVEQVERNSIFTVVHTIESTPTPTPPI